MHGTRYTVHATPRKGVGGEQAPPQDGTQGWGLPAEWQFVNLWVSRPDVVNFTTSIDILSRYWKVYIIFFEILTKMNTFK